MAKNDILLLDQILSEVANERTGSRGDIFQTFAIAELLKSYDLSLDEIDLGLVDGRDDGGIDAWYTFLDGELLTDPDDIATKRGPSFIEAWILTAKHHDTFKQEPVVNLYTTVLDLLDLTKQDDQLTDRYNEALISSRNIFKTALIKTARGAVNIRFRFCYLSRGDRKQLGASISARSKALVAEVGALFSNCDASFEYLGAPELLALSRKIKDFSAALKFEEGPLSRGGSNYVGLARLGDYMRFISDPGGELRRYLFESNVRDFLGLNFVNNSILATLKRKRPSDVEDFWWLNNGVTIIADNATVVGKELHLDNVQIVNGLQTTEAVHGFFAGRETHSEDDRCILVKVLVTPKRALADKIILAANNQNSVDLASLRATDKIQRDIEDILASKNWFYDRRKNYYLNHGKPSSRIVSMKFMSWAMMAVFFGEPYQCNRSRPKYMRSESSYRRLFSEEYDLKIYLAALEICKDVESVMLTQRMAADPYPPRNYATMYRFLYAHLYRMTRLGLRKRTEQEILRLWSEGVDPEVLRGIHEGTLRVRDRLNSTGRNLRRLHRSRDFQDLAAEECMRVLGSGEGRESDPANPG